MSPRRWLCALLTLVASISALAALAPRASAQQERVIGKPKPFICTPGQPGCHTYPPSVSISPGNSSYFSPTLAVTVTFCDSVSFSADTIYLNNVNKTSTLTETTPSGTGQCAVQRKYTGNITLVAGSNTL